MCGARGAAAQTAHVPCAPGAAEHASAVADLAALDGRIRAIAGARQLQAAQRDLERLLGSRCFDLSIDTWCGYQTPSVTAFKGWWAAGGHDWVASYLQADARLTFKEIVIPPDVLSSLVPGDQAGPPPGPALARLLCDAGDRGCGAETRGFRRRAELFFGTDRGTIFEDCARRARTAAGADPCAPAAQSRDYPGWRTCVTGERPRVPALPWGELRSPAGGWLVTRRSDDRSLVAGGRCQRTRFFQVDSGAAYRADHCPDGAGNPVTVAGGRVPAPALRELLWMLLLADRVDLRQVQAHHVRVPEGLLPRWPADRPGPDAGECGFGPGAHAVTLSWRWQGARGALAQEAVALGTSQPGPSYAATLLEVVDAAFQPGKPGTALPPALLEMAARELVPRDGK
jgi:hypothetical protein